jgi:hypothetical protein
MQIEEVLKEKECLEDLLLEMSMDLRETTKAILQLLKQNPANVKDFPYQDFLRRSIEKLVKATKFQP